MNSNIQDILAVYQKEDALLDQLARKKQTKIKDVHTLAHMTDSLLLNQSNSTTIFFNIVIKFKSL